MSAYAIFDIRHVGDAPAMERYRAGVLATVHQFGGRYLVIGGRCEGIEGDWRPAFPVVIEFPSFEAAKQWYDSDVYRELKAMRLAATEGDFALVDGLPADSEWGRPAPPR